MIKKGLLAIGIAALLALPASAVAQSGKTKHRSSHSRGHTGKHKGKNRNPLVAYRFRGSVESIDYEAKTVVISVKRANRHARRFVGHDVAFDFSRIRLTVADLDEDGVKDLYDVSEGDDIKVKVRLRRKLGALSGDPIAVRGKATCEHSEDGSEADDPEAEDSEAGEDDPAELEDVPGDDDLLDSPDE